MSDRKLILVGESATGKTTIAKLLEEKDGLTLLRTYTTRPQRIGESSRAYNFITKEAVQGYSDRILQTEHRGNTYFSTRSSLMNADVAILTKDAIPEVTTICDGTVVYLYCSDKEEQIKRLKEREPHLGDSVIVKYKLDDNYHEDFTEFDYEFDSCTMTIKELYEAIKERSM